MRAQIATEYFILIGVILVLILPIISLILSEYTSVMSNVNNLNSANWIIDLDSDIKNIKYQGNGSYIVKRYNYPIKSESITVRYQDNNTIMIFNISDYGDIVKIYPFRVNITSGRIVGNIVLNITNVDGDIVISVI
ncbi:MAG: hypothetical protein QXS53_00450 [Candidatus Anstonellales archaeon]